jgi:phosphoribosylformylglycinamidine cyclo-ligase
LPRVLPANNRAVIDTTSWERPNIFDLIQDYGEVATEEMYRTFNMGIGMSLVVPAHQADQILATASELGEEAYLIGEVQEGETDVQLTM